jgi:hypothetical protein
MSLPNLISPAKENPGKEETQRGDREGAEIPAPLRSRLDEIFVRKFPPSYGRGSMKLSCRGDAGCFLAFLRRALDPWFGRETVSPRNIGRGTRKLKGISIKLH